MRHFMQTLMWLIVLLPAAAGGRDLAGQARSLGMPEEERPNPSNNPVNADGTLRIMVAFRLCVDEQGVIACLEPLPEQNPALVKSYTPPNKGDLRIYTTGSNGLKKA